MARIGVPTYKRKTFPIWHQDSTDNPNYASEYKKCLGNLPVGGQTNTVENFGSISFTNRFTGGVVAPNGKIYLAPEAYNAIGIFDPSDNSYSEVPHGVSAANDEWLGGCLAPNGCIYFAPASASVILKIDPSDNSITTFGGYTTGASFWYSSVITSDGIMYCAPYNSTKILRIDTNTDTVTEFGSFAGFGKWSSGCLGFNGCIYFTPLDSASVLKIDPSDNDSTTLFGNIAGTTKYFGANISKDGIIYLTPAVATNVGRIDTNNDTVLSPLTTNVVAGQRGSAMGPNGKIYTANTSGTIFLEIDPETNTVTQLTNGYSGYYGINVAFNGKLYMTPRTTTKFCSVLIKIEGGVDKDFPLSRYNNKF